MLHCLGEPRENSSSDNPAARPEVAPFRLKPTKKTREKATGWLTVDNLRQREV